MKLFAELNTDDLKGYLILLDIDGTLTHNRLSAMEHATIEKVKELKKHNTIYLVSNRNDHPRNKKVGERANVDYLETNIRKPSKKIIKLLENPSKKPFLVIGDKFLTDGIFAKRIGAKFIKVKRLTSYKDSILAQITYFIDNLTYKLFS